MKVGLAVVALLFISAGSASAEENVRAGGVFGVREANQTEVFVAGDVSPAVTRAIEETLAVAVETWGSSGRMEYWVLGTDREAAKRLAAAFCERRVARGDMTRQACLDDSANTDHGFLMYQTIGADALATGKPHGSAGHNGGAEWGFHRMTSSLPLGFAGVLDVAGEEEQITILHEYWHSIQQSFLQSQDHETRQSLMGPVWFIEGSAVAMAEITFARLRATGRLRQWNKVDRPWPSLQERMVNKLKFVQSKKDHCSTLLPETYEDECRQLGYDAGAWAVAYLMHKKGDNVLLESFHPAVEELGWEAAFEKTFGRSSEAFAAEFAAFVDLPLSEQVRILPEI